MSDLAPGPRRRSPGGEAGSGRRSSQRQALLLAAAVLGALGLVRLLGRAFTERVLAEPLTVRAFGSTLAVTGFMVVVASRGGRSGPARIVGSLVGSLVTGVGLAKLVWPSGTLPWLGQLGPRGDGWLLVVVAVVVASLSLGRRA